MHCTPTLCREYNGRKSVKPSWQSITAKACGRSPACEGKPTMKEIMNKTLVVKFESTSPIKTVFNDGEYIFTTSGIVDKEVVKIFRFNCIGIQFNYLIGTADGICIEILSACNLDSHFLKRL